jgi:general secretion pathway protein K
VSPSTARRREGVVLLVVLFFVLLLTSSIATFLRRVAVDAGVATNRDRARQAEALARGGVRLAQVLLLEDLRLQQGQGVPKVDSPHSVWARVAGVNLIDDPDVSLVLDIEDAGARINLNGFLKKGSMDPQKRLLLGQFLAGVIAAMPGKSDEKRYDPAVLADNLIDWVDTDDVRQSGGPEDEPYQRRDPPYRSPNRPLLSVEELRLIDGFDGPLVEALRPYVTVFPLFPPSDALTINLNTAPPWVLAQIQVSPAVGESRPLQEDDVKRILDAREAGLICESNAQTGCTSAQDLFANQTIQPGPKFTSKIFVVRARARVFDVERTVEAVIDSSKASEMERLSWRVD